MWKAAGYDRSIADISHGSVVDGGHAQNIR
jgi:hypothetical protein